MVEIYTQYIIGAMTQKTMTKETPVFNSDHHWRKLLKPLTYYYSQVHTGVTRGLPM